MIEGIRGNIYLMGQQKGELKKKIYIYRFVSKGVKPNQMDWITKSYKQVLQTILWTLFVDMEERQVM